MELSGYSTGFIVTAINGEIRAHLKVLADHQQKGTPIHRPKNWEGRKKITRNRDLWFQPEGANGNMKYSSVIYVPSMPGSTLARMLQKKKEEINQRRAHWIRRVVKSEVTVRKFL